MQPNAKPNRTLLYIGIAAIALLVIGGVALLAYVANFLKSDRGKNMMATFSQMSRMEDVVPVIVEGLALYESRNGELPESLSQLADYGVSKEALNQAESALTYTRPDKDAPPDTVILQTKQMDFIEGATMKIEVTKDLNARQITTAPLNRR